MINVRFLQFGSVLCAAVAAIALAGGFQAQTEKVGVVDFSKVIEASEYGKAGQVSFTKLKADRETLLQFIDNYRVLTIEQATNIRDLSLKQDRSKEEEAKLESLKADVIAQSKKWQALATKSDMSAEDRALIEDYAKRAQSMGDTMQRWYKDFSNDLTTWSDKQKIEGIAKARAAVQEVAKAQGYSMVFEASVAPYSANDLTDATLAAMNAKK